MSTLFDICGYLDRDDVLWRLGEGWEANALLSRHHYLGPLHSGARMTIVGSRANEPVAAMMWKHPTSRSLPSDGSWLELSRWCLTPGAGENAGSRMHKWSLRLIREHLPAVTTLVSYSDPTHGHTGALYRACNWRWAPTWHRLRPAPSGHGDWGTGQQGVKDRWVFCVRRDARRDAVLSVDDAAAVRYWEAHATEEERRWARLSLNLSSVDVQVGDRVPVVMSGSLTARNAQPTPGDFLDHNVITIQPNDPAGSQVQQKGGVRFAPIQSHGYTVAKGGVA